MLRKLRKQVNNFLSILSGIRKKQFAACLLLLLSACGDNCYNGENIADDGQTYYNKSYSHQVLGTDSEWMNTDIEIKAADTFTITNVQGQFSGCGNPNAVGSCAISYTTMCQSGQKYLCTDSTCNSSTIINDCTGQSNCTQSNRCTGVPGKNKCVSGVLYNYDTSSSSWVQQGGSCIESVSCDSNSNKVLKTTYQIGTAPATPVYHNVDRTIGKCTTDEIKCDNGHAYPISAQNSNWTQIDYNIQPGDDLYLTILPPKANSGAMLSPLPINTARGDPSLNAFAIRDSMPGSHSNCPPVIPLTTTQSTYTSCNLFTNGYYTCPLCPTSTSGCPAPGLCWVVGGSGLWLKIIDTSEDCNATTGCDSSNCTFFDHNTSSDTTGKFGSITYIPTNSDGDGCGSDLSKCTNRTTKRHIIGPDGQKTKVCAKIADAPNDYHDNNGGYTVYATRTTCVSKDGRPSPLASLWKRKGWFGLEYIVSKTTPPSSQQGTAMTENVVYPYTITSPQAGKLFLRIRDDAYSDNTGYFNVMINYHQYVTGGALSNVIESVKDLLRSMTFNAATQYFHNITCTGDACNCQMGNCKSQYVDYVRALLILYMAGYGLSFMIGFVQITQYDLFIRIVKVGLVMALITDGSFNFFYNNFFDLFFDGMDDLIRKSQAGFSSTTEQGPVFAFVDSMISITILSKTTWLKLVGLMFTTPFGLILAILLIVSIVIFLIGIFKAVVVYLLATLVLGILMLLAPIFIPFVLFETTRHLFTNWVKMFAQYTLEPIILLVGLSFMTQLLYQLFSEIINFHVCWKCMWPINMPFIPSSMLNALGLSHTVFCLQWFGPFGLMPSGGALIAALGIEITDIIIVIILCHLILSYDALVQQMVLRITGGKAAQFMVSGKQGGFNSAGSAATHMLSRASFRGVSAASLASAGKEKIRRSARRAGLRLIKGKPEEDRLLGQAKGVDKQHRADIEQRSSAFSTGFGNLVSGRANEEKKVLQDPNASKDDKSVAAESIGRKAYDSMGDKAEFKGLMSNFSTLSSVEEGSKAHEELSGKAKKMHDILKDEGAKSALRTLSREDATEDEKRDAAGKFFQTIHEKDPELHEALHNDPTSSDAQEFIKEVNELERKPRTSLKAERDDEEEGDEDDE